MSGQVDAVIGAFRNFELNQMTIEGIKGKCFYPEEEGVPPYDELIFIVNNKITNKYFSLLLSYFNLKLFINISSHSIWNIKQIFKFPKLKNVNFL